MTTLRPLLLLLFFATLALLLPACEGGGAEGSIDGECSDGIDNDGDSIIDCEDPDCYSSADCGATDDDDAATDDDDAGDDDDDDDEDEDDDDDDDDD